MSLKQRKVKIKSCNKINDNEKAEGVEEDKGRGWEEA